MQLFRINRNRKQADLTYEFIKSKSGYIFFKNAHVGSELAVSEQYEYDNSNI